MLIYLCDCCHVKVVGEEALGRAFWKLRMPELSTMTAPACKKLKLDKQMNDYCYVSKSLGMLCTDCLLAFSAAVRDALASTSTERRKLRADRQDTVD